MQVLSILIVAILLSGCASENNAPPPPPPALSVLHIRAGNTITYQEYPASVEGVTNVEIRPQIEGLLQKVYADEGSYVVKGQPLFKIDEAPFRQRLNGAVAILSVLRFPESTEEWKSPWPKPVDR